MRWLATFKTADGLECQQFIETTITGPSERLIRPIMKAPSFKVLTDEENLKEMMKTPPRREYHLESRNLRNFCCLYREHFID